MAPNINKPVPGVKEFYPLNEPSIGNTLSPVGASFCCVHTAAQNNGYSP